MKVVEDSGYSKDTVEDLPWLPSLGNIYILHCSLFLHRGRCASSPPVRQKRNKKEIKICVHVLLQFLLFMFQMRCGAG